MDPEQPNPPDSTSWALSCSSATARNKVPSSRPNRWYLREERASVVCSQPPHLSSADLETERKRLLVTSPRFWSPGSCCPRHVLCQLQQILYIACRRPHCSTCLVYFRRLDCTAGRASCNKTRWASGILENKTHCFWQEEKWKVKLQIMQR